MSILAELDRIFAEKELPLKRQEIPNNQSLYQGQFKISEGKQIPFGIVVVHGEGVVDFQISFKRLGYLTNYDDKLKLLETINELNMGKTFYYHVCLSGDGEISMKTMGKTTEDVRPLYETLIIGSNVAKLVMGELQKQVPSVQ